MCLSSGAYLKLKQNEAKILARDRDTLREFNALVGDYEPEYYYWVIASPFIRFCSIRNCRPGFELIFFFCRLCSWQECIELGRKLVLAGFVRMHPSIRAAHINNGATILSRCLASPTAFCCYSLLPLP